MQETWEYITNFERMYQVSTLGRVRSVDRTITFQCKGKAKSRTFIGQVLSQANCKGYLFVALSINDKQTLIQVHRLVANTFIPNPDNKEQVNHKDFNRHNNNKDNLEWTTHQENINHYRNSLRYGV